MEEISEKEQKKSDETEFAALEKDFEEVIRELAGDKSLERFRVEYEKLHYALKKSYESEKRLMVKCRELNAEIVSNAAKVSVALKLSEEDQSTISSLKKEIEKAWKMVDGAHDKETRARETIMALKEEISNLTNLVEHGNGVNGNEMQELLKAKEILTKERDNKYEEVVKLRNELAIVSEACSKAENEKSEALFKISELKEEIQVKSNEGQREARKKEKLELEYQQVKSDAESKNNDLKLKQTQLQKLQDDLIRSEQQFKEQKVLNERVIKDTELNNVQAKEEEVNALKQDSLRLTRQREAIQRKLRTVEDLKIETDFHKETLKNQINALEKELETSKKQQEMDKKAIDDFVRERDILNKNLLKAAGSTQKQVDLVRLHEQAKKNLEVEIQNYKDEASKQRKIIFQMEKDRDRYINEASELTQKVLLHMEDVKVREMEIFDYKKKIAEAETKLKQQQNLYEAVRSDRNLCSKNLVESQDEITEMKRKLKIINHQIDQLKEEITSKETVIVKEHLEHQKIEKEKESLKAELQLLKKEATESKTYIEQQQIEEKKLTKIIQEADTERVKLKKELDQVISERDILGTQLVRRNDELALLYEKIKIQKSTLDKGSKLFKFLKIIFRL
uniref:Coiled-coil domain-containing protein 147 n=1 Tax=Hydra vulgaris TaxID=6087 RepID=T2MCK8_HYDVU